MRRDRLLSFKEDMVIYKMNVARQQSIRLAGVNREMTTITVSLQVTFNFVSLRYANGQRVICCNTVSILIWKYWNSAKLIFSPQDMSLPYYFIRLIWLLSIDICCLKLFCNNKTLLWKICIITVIYRKYRWSYLVKQSGQLQRNGWLINYHIFLEMNA